MASDVNGISIFNLVSYYFLVLDDAGSLFFMLLWFISWIEVTKRCDISLRADTESNLT